MESDANSAFEHNFPARVSSRSRLNTRENPLFPAKNQAKSEAPAFSAQSSDHLPASASPALAFRSPFLNTPTSATDDGLVHQDTVLTYFQRLQSNVQHTLADQVTPLRLAGHLSVLAVAAVILLMSQVKLP